MNPFVFAPRVPLVEVETHVNFQLHYDHVTQRRAIVEKAALPRTKRLAESIIVFGHPALPQARALADALERSLNATARFGYEQAQREVRSLRANQSISARYEIVDVGRYMDAARGGLERVRHVTRERAKQVAAAVARAALAAFALEDLLEDETKTRVQVTKAATRSLHNHVIELVGETLNLGRTAGALELRPVPEFALRSEQLDKNTCEPCGALHGLIAQLDTGEFYANTPPIGCLGGGRCRGIWVYGDSPRQMTSLEAA